MSSQYVFPLIQQLIPPLLWIVSYECLVRLTRAPKRKIFILDTSVLLHDPGALFVFGDNIVAIPMQARSVLN
jgi:hypothetical protein